MRWKVILFTTSAGREPVREFIDRLDPNTQTKVREMIASKLIPFGLAVRPPVSKVIATNLYELRIPGKTAVRIFYTFINLKIVLLHGFVKKSSRTPLKELRTARRRQKQQLDYL